jgi:hypothetical protein
MTRLFRKTAHFCSMKVNEDVRTFAPEHQLSEGEALRARMEEKAKKVSSCRRRIPVTLKDQERQALQD